MALVLRDSNGTEIPLATNKGWSLVGRWMEQAPNSPQMHRLYREGWAEPVGDLLGELHAANDANPPLNKSAAQTVLELLDSLEGLESDSAVVVTDGLSK